MDKRRLRVPLKVFGAVKDHFPDTKQFIVDSVQQKCLKEKISADEVIFFTSVSSEKHFLFCSEYVKRYCIKRNSLGYDISCVLSRFSLPKVLRFFTEKAGRKKQFCKNDGYGVVLQLLIM